MIICLLGESDPFSSEYASDMAGRQFEGRELIELYYQWSPVMVKVVEEDEAFKEELKNMIDKLLPMIEQAVE